MEIAPPLRRDALTLTAGGMLGLIMVLLIRRYAGINQDSILYLGQGMLQRWADIFSADLFFVHGSQGEYTLFPNLVAWAMGWASVPMVFLWGGLAGLLLFGASGWYCLRSLLPEGQRYWAWLGVLCLPTMYGMAGMFGYHEPFFTPRPVAEALCLLCIGLLARDRRIAAIACLVLGGMFHPLQAIAAALVVWPWLAMRDRRWLHAAWLLIPLLALGIAGVRPFDGLFRPIDPAWLKNLRELTGQLFLTEWGQDSFVTLLFDALLLAYASRMLRGPLARWSCAALSGLALGIGANLILVDWLHLALPAGLQLWRVQWLAHWFAMAVFAVLLYHDIKERSAARGLLLAMTAILVWTVGGWTWLPFAALYAVWPKLFAQGGHSRLMPLLGGLFAVGLIGLLANHVASEWILFRSVHYRLDLYPLDRRILAFPLIALGMPLLGTIAWARAGKALRWCLLVCLLFPLAALAAWRWDARPPLVMALERNAFRTDVFGISLPRDAQVYWDTDTLLGTWLVVHRASYFNRAQMAGIVFNRDTAIDVRERIDRMLPLIRESLSCEDRNRPWQERKDCNIGDASLRRACAPGIHRGPDYLILPYVQRQPALGTWTIADPVTGQAAATYRLHSCKDVMQALGAAQARPTAQATPMARSDQGR